MPTLSAHSDHQQDGQLLPSQSPTYSRDRKEHRATILHVGWSGCTELAMRFPPPYPRLQTCGGGHVEGAEMPNGGNPSAPTNVSLPHLLGSSEKYEHCSRRFRSA